MTLEHLNSGALHSRSNAPKAQYDKKSRTRRATAEMEQRPAPEQRWLFRAVPLEGESLSSIVERSAFQNGVTTRHFLSHLGFPDERRDIDRVSDDQLRRLEALMGYAAGRLQGTTLTNLVLRTLTEVREKGATEWCIGSGPYIRRPDAVCPQCIATDQVRYRRLHWRLGYVSSCHIHARALIDCCPNCEHAIVPRDSDIANWGGGADSDSPGATGQLDAGRFSCSRCGADLLQREVSLEPATAAGEASDAWAPLQRALIAEGRCRGDRRSDDGQDTPWGASDLAADLGCPFGFQFIAGVRALLAILHAPRVGEQLRKQLAPLADCEPQDLCGDGIRGQPPEAYSAVHRRHALNAVGFLVRDGLDSMISKLRSAGITPSALLQIDRYVPYWLAMPVRRELSTGRYSMSPDEIAAARELIVRKARVSAPIEN